MSPGFDGVKIHFTLDLKGLQKVIEIVMLDERLWYACSVTC